MFSGIIEGLSSVISVEKNHDTLRIVVERPSHFSDISLGDSISTNGVCLTVEKFDTNQMQFTLGAETLKVTGWTTENLQGKRLNLERSLKYGDRIHGHFVSGHVDSTAQVSRIEKGESWIVGFSVHSLNKKLLWKKGSVAFQGVSLTINEISQNEIEVCLIPETLLRTNLKSLNIGDTVNVEYDSWAKAFANFQEQRENSNGEVVKC